MSSQQNDFTLKRPGALIAALPAILGFVPEKSLVLVSVADGALGSVARVDLAEQLAERVEDLAGVVAAADPQAAIAVIVDADAAGCPVCVEEHRRICALLTAALSARGIVLWAAHLVDRVAAGGQWQCVDGCGSHGSVDDPSASPLAVAAVLDGRRLYGCRADLQKVVAVDGDRRAALASLMPEQQRPADVRTQRADVEAMMAAAARVAAGEQLADCELAALGCALTDIEVRDALFGLAVGERAGQAEMLWAVLARAVPDPSRVEALVLLAFSAYVRGDGPLAGVSLEAALRTNPAHRMAGMLDTALQAGLRPDKIRELAFTGRRLTERLGVRLPPRPGRRRRAG